MSTSGAVTPRASVRALTPSKQNIMGKEGKRPAHAAGAAPPADGRPAKKGRAEAASSASALPDEWQTDGAGVEVSILRLHHYPLLVVRAQQHTLIA